MARFRGRVALWFDTALVPVGPEGEACDRRWRTIDEGPGIRAQVELYGPELHNRTLTRIGRKPLLDPRDGPTHTDTLAELRQWENAWRPRPAGPGAVPHPGPAPGGGRPARPVLDLCLSGRPRSTNDHAVARAARDRALRLHGRAG